MNRLRCVLLLTLMPVFFSLTALLPHNLTQAQVLNCDAVSFSAAEAVPFTQLEITGIPEVAGPELILQIMIDDEEAGRVLAAREGDGRYVMYAPVNPEFSLEPLAVHLRFLDDVEEAGLHSCGDFPFQILALPPAPGYFGDYLSGFRQNMQAIGEVTRPLSPELAQTDFEEVPFAERPAIWSSRLLYGFEEWPGLEVVLSGEYFEGRLTSEEWETIEAIYANRPALSGVSFYRFGFDPENIPYRENLEGPDDGETGSLMIEPDPAVLLIADAGSAAGTYIMSLAAIRSPYSEVLPQDRPMVQSCNDPFYKPTAPMLQNYFMAQQNAARMADQIQQAGDYVADLQVSLFAVGAMAGPKGAAASRLAAVTASNVAGLAMAAANLSNQMMQSVMPVELGSFTLEHGGPYEFKEDDEEMDVNWELAEVSAISSEFDATQAAAEFAWSVGGGRVVERAYRNVQGRMPWLSALEQEGAGIGIGKIVESLNLESLKFPACLFGPVDITEEPWTISYTGVSGREHLLEKIDHQNFEVRETGEASPYVCVAAELMNPGASGCQGGVPRQFIPVNTKAIEVRITTLSGAIARSRQEKPGTTLVYIAEVRNANNEQVSWSVSNSKHTLWQGGTDNHEATIELSTDSDDFPFTLTVESTSTTGLRAMPDSPPRRHSITISELEEDERFSCLNEFEIAMTELDRCGFVAYLQGTLPGSDRMPPVPISECVTGEIYRWMVNTHGIHHLEMRGRFEHGNAQITLRVDYDGLAKLETSDFAVYGYLMKGIMQPTRTPRGQPGPDRRQPRLSEALELRSGDLTIYPLAGMPYYGSVFKFELKPYTETRRLRGTGYTVEGMLMGGESCP